MQEETKIQKTRENPRDTERNRNKSGQMGKGRERKSIHGKKTSKSDPKGPCGTLGPPPVVGPLPTASAPGLSALSCREQGRRKQRREREEYRRGMR